MAPLLLDLDRPSQLTEINARPASGGEHATVPVRDPFFVEKVLTLAGIIVVALWLRAQDPGYSTAYMDESVYVLYGRMFLAKSFEAPLDHPLRWSFGWYLWPILAAWAERLGGLIAVRELAAGLGTVTVVAVFGFARRLYGVATALGSAAIFAVLAPAVMTSRIATRDSGAICFFALGLWLYLRAWQQRDRCAWLGAAVAFTAAFLCKYIVAVYFPPLVLLTLSRRRGLLYFALPLSAAMAVYGAWYRQDLMGLLSYGTGYGSLRAVGPQVLQVYVWQRLDFWLICALALLASAHRKQRNHTACLWLGACLGLGFQLATRADYDWWKHAVYVLIFLTPVAVHGLLALVRRATGKHYQVFGIVALCAVLSVVTAIAASGRVAHFDRLLFWPNVEPALAMLEGRLASNHRVLVDDSIFRYYFSPELRQQQIIDPYYFHYGQLEGPTAYARAVRDGQFDYIVLDGGMEKEAREMQSAIAPFLGGYVLRLRMPDPALGHLVQIYERSHPVPLVPTTPAEVTLDFPQTGALVTGTQVAVRGHVSGANPGWRVRCEIFTDRWYELGTKEPASDGSFDFRATLAGEGQQQCYHMVRARAYDMHGAPQAVAVSFAITRLNQDGSLPVCAAGQASARSQTASVSRS